MGDFASSHLKIKRANKHISDLQSAIRSLPEAYAVTVERDEKTRRQSIKFGLPNAESTAIDLALTIGDAIHNLRTALEYAWIASIKRLVPSALDGHTKFPVRETKERLESALKGRKIDIAAPALFNRIVSDIRPYRGGNDAICSLHHLDVSDKHRLLIPLMQVLAVEGVTLEDENGQILRGGTWATTRPGPYFIDLEGNWHIKESGKVALAIVFENGTNLEGTEVSDMLSSFSIHALSAVQLLENLY
jgi:hypothetical protein